VRTDYR